MTLSIAANTRSPCRTVTKAPRPTRSSRSHWPWGRRRREGASATVKVRRTAEREERATCSRCRSRSVEIWRQTSIPRTLLPCGSSGGEKTAIPSWPGSTARTPPATPLFAGMPTSTTHSPAASYMPQVVITLSTRSTYSRSSARSPVTGLTPPLARVAAIRLRSRQSTRDRALAEVEVEGELGVLLEDPEAAQHVADRAVAVAGVALGLVDRGIDRQLAAGEAAVGVEDARARARRRRRRRPARRR